MVIIAACLHKGDTAVFEDETITVARVEYSTPEPGKITFISTDGKPYPLSAIADVTIL